MRKRGLIEWIKGSHDRVLIKVASFLSWEGSDFAHSSFVSKQLHGTGALNLSEKDEWSQTKGIAPAINTSQAGTRKSWVAGAVVEQLRNRHKWTTGQPTLSQAGIDLQDRRLHVTCF
jgi:hypothetical protein